MNADATTLGATTSPDATGGADAPAVRELDADPGASLTSDVALFGDALAGAAGGLEASPVARAVMGPFDAIDRQAAALGTEAFSAMDRGEELTPSELVELTMRSQEFMFHSQLTANVANRTADGIQQLFRQQG